MAADILLYSAKYVPVGEDQFQHLEITRDLALRFNRKFGEIFVVPEPTVKQVQFMDLSEGLRIRSLTHPEKKMSKSAADEKSKILLSDDPEAAAKKIMSATTDSAGKIQFDMFNQPGISNLLQILSLLKNEPLQDVIARFAGETNYGDLKQEVALVVKNFLRDFQEKVAGISDERVLEVLATGEARMREKANAKLLEVQKAVGVRR
jgi:tryptophanyl-tRNA synthetase